MPTTIVQSSPDHFVSDLNAGQNAITFAVPAGVYTTAYWTRVYSVTANEANPGVHPVVIQVNGHAASWPGLSGPSSGSDTMQATALQLADINAAAGGAPMAALYGRASADSDFAVETISSLRLVLTSAGGTTMRFERATVYEGAQIGVEATPGTPVAANKRLLGLEIQLDSMPDIKLFRPQGNKFNTAQQVGKEWTSGRIQGIQCYNDMLYVASSWLANAVISTPVNNSTFNLTGASGTIGFTYKGAVLAPASFANAAALQAAIEAMTPVGAGNVKVTGAAPAYKVQFIGSLSTDTSAITAPTGSPAPTIALDTAATLTRRWTFLMAPAGPDTVTTFTVEKGAAGVANMAQQAPFGFVHGLTVKNTKDEASINGDFACQITTDPFTMTPTPTDVACVPVDMKAAKVWAGPTLTGMALLDRILEFEFGVANRASGLMTLNADDPSFSNRIENAPDLTSRFFQEHDAAGQTMLARMRAGTDMFAILESVGPSIEPGFNYRMKWTMCMAVTKPNTGDVDGVYGHNYDSGLKYNSGLGGAIKLEIDSPLTAL